MIGSPRSTSMHIPISEPVACNYRPLPPAPAGQNGAALRGDEQVHQSEAKPVRFTAERHQASFFNQDTEVCYQDTVSGRSREDLTPST